MSNIVSHFKILPNVSLGTSPFNVQLQLQGFRPTPSNGNSGTFQLVRPLFAAPAGYAVNLIWATKQLFDRSRKKKNLPFSENCLCFALRADVAAPCLCFASRRFYHADVPAPFFASRCFTVQMSQHLSLLPMTYLAI